MSDEMSKSGGASKLSATEAKKLEEAITDKEELEARAQTLTTKLKCTEEALSELKSKVPNEVATEIENMLQRRLSSELASVAAAKQAPPPPPPPPPPFFGGGAPPPPPPPPPPSGLLGKWFISCS